MVRQGKTKRPDFVGKGKVTPVQIAFIVDRYLFDNSFTQTRSSFRSEASHLLSKSPVGEFPRSLLSLGAILEEYITLKEQKVSVEKEMRRLEQESIRVQNLFKGMQDVTNAYNAGTNHVFAPSPQPLPLVGGLIQAENSVVTTPGGPYPMYKSSSMISVSRPWSNGTYSNNFLTPITNHATTKRKGSKNVSGDPVILKRSRSSTQSKDVNLATQVNSAETNQEKSLMNSSTHSYRVDNAPSTGSQLQGSNVVKCLFNQKPQSPPVNASVPQTPPHASSSSSESERSTSPSETFSTANFSKDVTPQRMMSTNRTMISSQTIHVSPNKQISYCSVEKNRCFSTSSPFKTRLNFDASDMGIVTENQSPEGTTSASESDKEGDNLDMEFPNLDALGLDFNLSEFLLAFDMESEGLGLSDSSPDSYTCPSSSLIDARQQFSSDVTGILEDKDMNVIGSDSVVSKCVLLSPVKSRRSNSDQENTPVRN